MELSSFSSTVKAFPYAPSYAVLTETSTDVVCGFFHSGTREEPARLPLFDELTLQEEDSLLRHTSSLLHIMRDNHNGIGIPEFPD